MAKDLNNIVSSVAGGAEEKKKVEEELKQIVVFILDNEEFAISIEDLREVVKIPEITPIPNAPKFISGILNLRGKIVVVVDLEKRFELVREGKVKPEHIIISEVGNNSFGVIVDSVKEVLRVPVSKIQKAPGLVSAKIHADYIQGVIVFDEEDDKKEKKSKKDNESRLIVLIDLPKMLQEEELLGLGKMVRTATKK